MKRVRRKRQEAVELSMDEIQQSGISDFSEDISAFSEKLDSIISSRSSRSSREQVSDNDSSFDKTDIFHNITEPLPKKPTKTLKSKPDKKEKPHTPTEKRVPKKIIKPSVVNIPTKKEINKKKRISSKQETEEKTKEKTEKVSDEKYISEQTKDYVLVDHSKFACIGLYDQIRYVNDAGKFVNGGFIVKMEYDLGQSKTFWLVSADRRSTGFCWKICPDKIQKLWKKNIHLPEVDLISNQIDYINNFLSAKYGAEFSKNIPKI